MRTGAIIVACVAILTIGIFAILAGLKSLDDVVKAIIIIVMALGLGGGALKTLKK